MNDHVSLLGGLIAFVFFTYFAGTYFHVFIKKTNNTTINIIERIVGSIYISWLVVFLSFVFDIGDVTLFLVITLILYAAGKERMYFSFEIKSSSLLLILIFLALVDIPFDYDATFRKYDAMVVWNNMASDLYNNIHVPYSIPYPPLLPGLWSLIYKAQGSVEFQIISKATLFVIFAVSIATTFFLASKNRVLGYSLFLFICFIGISQSNNLFKGDMDGPLFFIIFSCLVFILTICMSLEESRDTKYIERLVITASIIFGLASITKQAGALALALFFGVVLFLFYRGKINKSVSILSIIISTTPLVLYLIMYFTSAENLLSFADFDYMSSLSNSRNSNSNFEKIMKFNNVLSYNLPIILAILGLVSIFISRGYIKFFNIIMILLFVVGIISMSYCCSYSSRNFTWLLAPVLLSTATILYRPTWIKGVVPKFILAFWSFGSGKSKRLIDLISLFIVNIREKLPPSLNGVIDKNVVLQVNPSTIGLFIKSTVSTPLRSVVTFIIYLLLVTTIIDIGGTLISINDTERNDFPGAYIIKQHINFEDDDYILISYDASAEFAPKVRNFGVPSTPPNLVKLTKFDAQLSRCLKNMNISINGPIEIDALEKCTDYVVVFGYSSLIKGKTFSSNNTSTKTIYDKSGYTMLKIESIK